MEQEQYRYFDVDSLIEAQGFTKEERRKGEQLVGSGKLTLDNMEVGYLPGEDEMVCCAQWSGRDNSQYINSRITFSRNAIMNTRCNCPSCTQGHYSWYFAESSSLHCGYLAGLLLTVKKELEENPRGDATSRKASHLMQQLSGRRLKQVTARAEEKDQQISLSPLLRASQGDLTLAFRIVENKTLMIRDLFEFTDHVDKGETALYGTKTQISHKLDNFDPASRQWISFIREILQEEERTRARMERQAEKMYSYYREKKFSALDLYGWRLDRFYDMIRTGGVTYEYAIRTPSSGSGSKKVKNEIRTRETDLQIPLQITPVVQKRKTVRLLDSVPADSVSPGAASYNSGAAAPLTTRRGRPRKTPTAAPPPAAETVETEVFHGIKADFHIPDFYYGTENLYYIDQTKSFLCCTDRAKLSVLEPLMREAEHGHLTFEIGRSRLAEFYYSVLPQFGDAVAITEENPDLIRQYLPADVAFVFYLDVRDGDITCRPCAVYDDGKQEVSLLDQRDSRPLQPWRMADREREILYQLLRLFQESEDDDADELTTGGDEDAVYRFLDTGLAQLEELGEVRVTGRFRSLNVIRQVRVSVGVSMESDLLNLEIATEDLTAEELLDVLHSYRFKKRYYRLKNGSFLNLEDPNLGMLDEMVTTLQITDKAFLKGNIHLPIYRTLYLNRLLEENENVYNTRDSRFRAMVRNFKTVQEADYEVPASLRSILRGYQITGYKWLRTLESSGFGGILADEMGLGKTLQTIAVLLARKEERSREQEASLQADPNGAERPLSPAPVSLVVSPASLVYNWCEEFTRFAPSLSVLAVTGTQAERSQKIASWQEYDVLVTSYDLLKRDIAEYEDKTFDFEVIDEAQYIKNHTTAAAKAVKVIHASHRLALTGTPVENRLSELWSIFDYLMPGFLYRYETFRKQIETPIVRNQDADAMNRLQKMTGPFILRRLKSEVLRDLPDKLEENRYVRMEGEQRKLYDAQAVKMQTLLSGQSESEFQKARIQILAEITRLRQICCDPSLCVEGYHGASAKLEGCMELIQSAIDGGHRIVLFSQFVSMLEILQERLRQSELEFYCITGSTSKEKRLQLVKAFNTNDIPIFLVSLKAGGVGLNLTGADVVIHYDPWWNLAVQNQATDRTHRIGQTKKVTVYKMIASQSIEEKIQKLQETKKDLAEQVLNAGEGQLSQMSREDLLDLLT